MQETRIPLQTIQSSLGVYKHMHAPRPAYGMDIFDPGFDPHDIVLLSNNGEGNKGIPIRCDHYIMVFCLQGTGVRRVNHHQFKIEPNSVHLILPGQIHSFWDTTPDFQIYVLLFDKSVLSRFRLALPELDRMLIFEFSRNPNIHLEAEESKEWLNAFNVINEEMVKQRPYCKEASTAGIMQLLIKFRRKSTNHLASPEEYKSQTHLFLRFKSLVEDHFEHVRTVKEYAEMMCLSSKHLSDCIKKATGHSALHYIHERLIHEAEYLLTYTQMSIKEIAYTLQFDDNSHFSRFFKKHKSQTPMAFRKVYA